MLLVPCLVIALFAIAISASAATPKAAQAAHSAEIEFALEASNGLHVEVETSSEGVTLEVSRPGRIASYRVQGEATEAGLKARFGKLGSIDVTFEPTKTRTDKPPKGCSGTPSTNSEGLFVGTIEFTGEREYVQVAATQAKGRLSVYREGEWKCHRRREPSPPHVSHRLSRPGPRSQPQPDEGPATLAVMNRRCICFFAAYAVPNRKRRGQTVFVGEKFEKVDGMEIIRGTFVNGAPATFAFNHKAGTAQASPPHPFSGSGTFKRKPNGPDLWRSTIQVPLLGSDPLDLSDPGYRAKLVRALPGGE